MKYCVPASDLLSIHKVKKSGKEKVYKGSNQTLRLPEHCDFIKATEQRRKLERQIFVGTV